MASQIGYLLGGGEGVGPAPRTAPAAAVPATHVNRIVLAAFYLMVFSFNFEMPDRGGWEIPAMTAALFIGSTPLALRACYGQVPRVNLGDVRHYFIVLVEAAIVCWASVNLLSREAIGTGALWCFVLSALARSVLPMVGVGRTSYAVWTGGERVTAFGQNANFSAILLSAGLVTLLGLTFGRPKTSHRMRLLAVPIGLLIGAAIIETGSRGGLVSLGGGLIALMFTAGGNLKVRLRNGLVTGLAIGLLTYAAFTATVMKNRLEATAETGTLAGREQLWPSLVEMALEKPWAGWGPINNQYEVAARTTDMAREHRDAHNLLLELMTAEGLVGTVPFLIGLGICVAAAWRGRASPYGIVPFALLALFLVANISTNLAAYKPFWWVLALAMGGAQLVPRDGGSRPCAA